MWLRFVVSNSMQLRLPFRGGKVHTCAGEAIPVPDHSHWIAQPQSWPLLMVLSMVLKVHILYAAMWRTIPFSDQHISLFCVPCVFVIWIFKSSFPVDCAIVFLAFCSFLVDYLSDCVQVCLVSILTPGYIRDCVSFVLQLSLVSEFNFMTVFQSAGIGKDLPSAFLLLASQVHGSSRYCAEHNGQR